MLTATLLRTGIHQPTVCLTTGKVVWGWCSASVELRPHRLIIAFRMTGIGLRVRATECRKVADQRLPQTAQIDPYAHLETMRTFLCLLSGMRCFGGGAGGRVGLKSA